MRQKCSWKCVGWASRLRLQIQLNWPEPVSLILRLNPRILMVTLRRITYTTLKIWTSSLIGRHVFSLILIGRERHQASVSMKTNLSICHDSSNTKRIRHPRWLVNWELWWTWNVPTSIWPNRKRKIFYRYYQSQGFTHQSRTRPNQTQKLSDKFELSGWFDHCMWDREKDIEYPMI